MPKVIFWVWNEFIGKRALFIFVSKITLIQYLHSKKFIDFTRIKFTVKFYYIIFDTALKSKLSRNILIIPWQNLSLNLTWFSLDVVKSI